ncbi:MAG: DUF309 domain-containing protein [Nitriliruptoraceae bacterium]
MPDPVDEPTASAPSGRDRRDDGRPEQARPRDRTGRPLPYDTTGVPVTEDHEPTDVEEALVLGARLWDEQRFFEAHECLEHVWHAAPPEDTRFWQGVIQLAVAGVHLQRGNPAGARTLLARVTERLEAYPAVHRGVDVAGALATARRVLADLATGVPPEAAGIGPFPHASGGAWFAREVGDTGPATRPTPLPEGPRWLAEGQPRPAMRR